MPLTLGTMRNGLMDLDPIAGFRHAQTMILSPVERSLINNIGELGKMLAEVGLTQHRIATLLAEKLPNLTDDEKLTLLAPIESSQQQLQQFLQAASKMKEVARS